MNEKAQRMDDTWLILDVKDKDLKKKFDGICCLFVGENDLFELIIGRMSELDIY